MQKTRIGLQSQPFTLDGEEYEVTALDFHTARPLVVRLMKALGAGAGAGGGGEFIAKVLESLPLELVEDLNRAFAGTCTVRRPDGAKPYVETVAMFHFAQRYAHWVKWMVQCARWNFQDFLGATALASLLEKAQGTSVSESPNT